MSPARPRGPAAARLLLLLGALPLLLLPRAPGVRGDCGPLPVVPLAKPVSGGSTSFPKDTKVEYRCDPGFVKVPNLPNAVVCLSNNKWTDIKQFCNRSCDVPPRLIYAALKEIYIKMNYLPPGSVVEYECRPGFRRLYPLVGKSTCLENLTWTAPDEFCEKKSCPTPREIENGHINVATDILMGSQIFFSCDVGYRLQGVASTFCMAVENGVDWSDAFPVCTKILCPEPPHIKNGQIINERDTYEYRQVVTYECDRGFAMVGEKQIFCTVTDDTGEWSGPPPECKGKSPPPLIPPTVQKPTTTVPDVETPPPPQKASTVLPATSRPPVSRISTRPPTTASEEKGLSSGTKSLIYGFVAGTVIIGSLFVAKVFWDRGKSGHYMTQENNKAPIVNTSNEADATSEIRPLSDKLQKDTHV